MSKWFVLVNPEAGGRKAILQWPKIQGALKDAGIDFEFEISNNTYEAICKIQDAIRSGFRYFIAVGGDGTISLLINAIFLQKEIDPKLITVALLPMGTGNDWIRTQKIPKSLEGAIQTIVRGNSMAHDVGRLRVRKSPIETEQHFINMAGFGFEGFVAERIEKASSKMKKGAASYVMGMLDALFKYKETQMIIRLDDYMVEADILNVNVGICKYCGGGMKMTPDAICNDGIFDVTVVKKMGKGEVLVNVPRLFNGSFVRNKKVSRHRAKKISIISDPLIPAECDGEVIGYGNVEAEIIEKAINVMVPKSGK